MKQDISTGPLKSDIGILIEDVSKLKVKTYPIQKARESYRITNEQKEYLKELKR